MSRHTAVLEVKEVRETVYTLTLTMTEREAKALQGVLSLIGGSMDGPLGFIDAIWNTLWSSLNTLMVDMPEGVSYLASSSPKWLTLADDWPQD